MGRRLFALRKHGSTLLETVIAFFLLAGGAAVLVGLYASTLNTQQEDVEASTLVMLARSRVAELRALATSFPGYQALDGSQGSVNPTDFPSYLVTTMVSDLARPFPCTGMTIATYQQSYKQVQVQTTGPSGRTLALSSVIGVPVQEVGELLVTQTTGTNPLAADASADFVASLRDPNGAEIPDVRFRFYVDFGSGNGHLEEDPDGKTLHFFNYIPNLTGPNLHTGGEAKIIGRTFYAGQEYRGVSGSLVLSL